MQHRKHIEQRQSICFVFDIVQNSGSSLKSSIDVSMSRFRLLWCVLEHFMTMPLEIISILVQSAMTSSDECSCLDDRKCM